MKYLILLLPLLGFGCVRLGGVSVADTVSSTLVTAQKSYYSTYGKYKFVPPTTTNGISYKVHEYLCPDGTKGYQIWLEKLDGSKRSFGEGCEAKNWSYDWTPPTPPTTTI